MRKILVLLNLIIIFLCTGCFDDTKDFILRPEIEKLSQILYSDVDELTEITYTIGLSGEYYAKCNVVDIGYKVSIKHTNIVNAVYNENDKLSIISTYNIDTKEETITTEYCEYDSLISYSRAMLTNYYPDEYIYCIYDFVSILLKVIQNGRNYTFEPDLYEIYFCFDFLVSDIRDEELLVSILKAKHGDDIMNIIGRPSAKSTIRVFTDINSTKLLSRLEIKMYDQYLLLLK